MAAESKDYGYVWEGEGNGRSSITEIYFSGATSVDAIDAIAYCENADKTAELYKEVVSAGYLTYDVLTGYFTCRCPFDAVSSSWKLFIWKRNGSLSYGDLKWTTGSVIPVGNIISEINLLRDRVMRLTTQAARAIKTAEEGTNETYIPPKAIRAGKVLGFDDEGKPTVGENCAQVKALFEAQDNCEAYVKQAALQADAAREQAGHAQAYAWGATEAAQEASEQADTVEDLATECLAWYQKTSSAGAVAMNNAKLYAAEAKESAAAAEESAERAETAAEAIEKSNEDLNKALCYVACSVKRIEAADESAGNAASSAAEDAAAALESRVAASASAAEAYKYAQQLSGIYKYCGTVATEADLPVDGNINGDVYNVAETGKNFAWDGERWDALGAEVEYALADGGTLNGATLDSQSGVKVSVEMGDVAFADNANMYAYVGTFANCGCTGLRITPKTIAFYRRNTNLSVDTNVPRYLRVLRKNAQNEWYIAYQSTNGLAPNSFSLAGALMTWTMAEVDGGAIPTDERIAIVQCDAEDADLDRRVLWGAKITGAYSGGVGEDNIDNPTILAFAPAIRMTYDAALPLATTADVEEERRERAESDSAFGAAVEAEVARATAAEQANAAAIALKANDADVVHKTGDETVSGVKTWANNIDINGKTVIEADVGDGVLKFRPKSSTAQTVIKRDGANVVIQTQNAGVAQTTWTFRISSYGANAEVVIGYNCSPRFIGHEDSGGMALCYEGINPEQRLILPYFNGEDRTIATTSDIPDVSGLVSRIAELEAKVAELEAKVAENEA